MKKVSAKTMRKLFNVLKKTRKSKRHLLLKKLHGDDALASFAKFLT
jgi:hypothetical protein